MKICGSSSSEFRIFLSLIKITVFIFQILIADENYGQILWLFFQIGLFASFSSTKENLLRPTHVLRLLSAAVCCCEWEWLSICGFDWKTLCCFEYICLRVVKLFIFSSNKLSFSMHAFHFFVYLFISTFQNNNYGLNGNFLNVNIETRYKTTCKHST